MSGAPVAPAALLADIDQTVRCAVRSGFDAWARPEPPPSDIEAEGAVLSAMLSERITADDLPVALQGKHFLFAQHGELFELLRETTDPQALYMQLRERGYGPGASVMIAELTELPGEPHLSREHLAMAASRLVELWRVRQLCQRVRTVIAQVECGAVGAVESAQLLREVYREIRE